MSSASWPFPAMVLSVAHSHGLVAVGLLDGFLELRMASTGHKVNRWKAHRVGMRALLFTRSANGLLTGLVSGSHDGKVKRWEVESGAEVWAKALGIGPVFGVVEVAEGRLGVFGQQDDSVTVLEGATGAPLWVCAVGVARNRVRAAVPLDAGSLMATASEDKRIRVWAGEATLVRAVDAGEKVLSLSPSPCGRFVAAGSLEGSVFLYRLPDWAREWSVTPHHLGVMSVSLRARFLASGSVDRTVALLSADTGATLMTLREHTDLISAVAFSEDGTRIVSGAQDKRVLVWRIFLPMERRVKALCEGLVVEDKADFDRDGLREVVRRMKRVWEI